MRKVHTLSGMTTEQLEAFLAIAERRQLTDAARRLGISQPTLSRQLQALEQELGVRLFVRTARGAVLSEPGERFLSFARDGVAALREGASEVHSLTSTVSGPVSLGTLPTVGAYVLPDVVQAFLAKFPDVQLRLNEDLPEQLKERIAGGDLDLAIIELPLRRKDLVAQKLWEEPYALVVPRGHRLATAKGPSKFVTVQVEAAPRRTVALVHRGERSLTFAARALKRFLAERLRQRPQKDPGGARRALSSRA